jgi:2-polyprenyl-3-methyl-5-hydroxy-6-metoxy-1,4-benzoquinol methylase
VLDASPYEGADTIHDMNTPVPEAWHGRYDVVSGSLEHIFNFSVAIANLANMLRVGGTIFVTTPVNNLMGHGVYQFSPELYSSRRRPTTSWDMGSIRSARN